MLLFKIDVRYSIVSTRRLAKQWYYNVKSVKLFIKCKIRITHKLIRDTINVITNRPVRSSDFSLDLILIWSLNFWIFRSDLDLLLRNIFRSDPISIFTNLSRYDLDLYKSCSINQYHNIFVTITFFKTYLQFTILWNRKYALSLFQYEQKT